MTSYRVNSLAEMQLTAPSMVSIGVFDGVHLGHQQLVRRVVAEARASNLTSVILTFFPHPDVVLKRVTGRYYLTSPETRAQLLAALGVDLVITHAFDEHISRTRAADFVDLLCSRVAMKALKVGVDFALGYKREGNVDFLTALGQAKGYTVEAVDLRYSDHGRVISSSDIRTALTAGRVDQAMHWLGRPYDIEGNVVKGDQRGRTIGFPTANLRVWEEKLLPDNGVYACWAYVGDERHMAVVNIGIQPTFGGSQKKVEAHLLDFNRDLYGQSVRLEFIAHLRPEQRFESVEALVFQIGRDAEDARALLAALAPREQGQGTADGI